MIEPIYWALLPPTEYPLICNVELTTGLLIPDLTGSQEPPDPEIYAPSGFVVSSSSPRPL